MACDRFLPCLAVCARCGRDMQVDQTGLDELRAIKQRATELAPFHLGMTTYAYQHAVAARKILGES